MIYRLVRIVVNSFAGCLLLLVAGVFFSYNILLSLILILVSLDQFEDVYYYVYKKRLVPFWLMPLDLVFEGMCASVGVGIALFSIMYMLYFQTWFFQALLALAIPIIWSSVEDIVQWSATVRTSEVVACAFCEKERRFVRRKQTEA